MFEEYINVEYIVNQRVWNIKRVNSTFGAISVLCWGKMYTTQTAMYGSRPNSPFPTSTSLVCLPPTPIKPVPGDIYAFEGII